MLSAALLPPRRPSQLPSAPLPPPATAGKKALRVSLTQTQPFEATFGKRQTRKRPRLLADTYEDLLDQAETTCDRCAVCSRPKECRPSSGGGGGGGGRCTLSRGWGGSWQSVWPAPCV
jgi:hypothetical protein